MQIASFAEWRASKNRELFIVSFGSEGLITSENSCREIAGLFRMAQRGHVQTLTPRTWEGVGYHADVSDEANAD